MSKCTDPGRGTLLHAYELKLLSEEETELFELHLLECEYCLNRLRSFEQKTEMLTSANEVAQLIEETTEVERTDKVSVLRRLWKHIWPETPWVLKPALAYVLILLMILPTYYGLRELTKDKSRTVQHIDLGSPTRTAVRETFRISEDSDAIITFEYGHAVTGESYKLIIKSDDDRVILRDDDFESFDENKIGWVLIPFTKVKPGGYWLVITDPRSEPAFSQEYGFRIEK